MLYRITVKQNKNHNGIRIDKRMSVYVVINAFSNPVITNGRQSIVEANMRLCGVDIKRTGALNITELDVQRIG